MISETNRAEVVAEITKLYQQYEAALCENDAETLISFFWDSPEVVRFGPTENLYGSEQIKAFRRSRPDVKLRRQTSNFKATVLDAQTAIVTLEFYGGVIDKPAQAGRLTQVWRNLPEGWKIVSAHVSWLQ